MISGRRVAVGFHLAVLVYLLLMLSTLGELSPAARFFPYVVAAITIPLVGVEFVRIFSPDAVHRIEARISAEPDEPFAGRAINDQELLTFGWMVLLFVLIYVFGILVGIFAATFGYIAQRERNYRLALAVSAAMTVTVYLLLRVIFSKLLWSGIVPIVPM